MYPRRFRAAAAAVPRHPLAHIARCRRGRGQSPSATRMPLLVHEIDGSEGEDKPRRVKRTRHDIPRPTYQASSECVEMLWCGELARVHVVERSPLLLIIARGLCPKHHL